MSDGSGIERVDLDKVDWRGSREFFESLGEALDKLDDHDEAYDFTWVGKRKSIIEAGAPINKTLRPDVDASKNWDSTENLFIEGDNLDALKLLQESYLGKVKMIYIDPPYNTGKDFVYHDNFKATTDQYDEDTEYRDEDGNIQFKKNEKSNGRYHSDWLSMMYPRLKLARNLLSEDGVIFISIDDNEQANLKKLCDEVFGEDNFVAELVWQNRVSPANDAKWFSGDHEYILVYARIKDSWYPNRLERTEKQNSYYTNPDNDPRGPWNSAAYTCNKNSDERPNLYYPITNPNTGEEIWPRKTAVWAYSKETHEENVRNGLLYWGTDGKSKSPRRKQYLSDAKKVVPRSVLNYSDVGSTQSSTIEFLKLFDANYFQYTKPTSMISRIIQHGTNEGDIILDFFSGSATTAHAVMQLNAEDGGNRKWIMVQLPEETDEKSEAYKAGYRTIPEISRERIRRAGDKIASEHPDAKVDYGFRALRIDDTNMKDVYRPAADVQQSMLDDLVDNVREDRSDLDLLFGVLSQSALELNRPLETVQLDGTTVYKYDYFGEVSGLVACFAPEISEATIKSIAAMRPLTAVFREASFPDSQAKVNLAEHFRIISPDTKVKVV
jgi:adenine-specific DNA-methyltransferase